MTTTTKSASRTYSLIGAGVGLAIFLAVGLLPSILYGGYAGVLLAGGIFGTPIDGSMAVRALIVAGMVLGVTATAALFAVAGAAAGSAIAALTGSSRKVDEVEALSTSKHHKS